MEPTAREVIAEHSPRRSGVGIYSRDLGLLVSDGTRFHAIDPPIPPAAALVGLNKHLYTCLPVVDDVGFDSTVPGFRLYAGALTSSDVPDAECFGTSPDNQLRMYYAGKGVLQMATTNVIKSTTVDKNVGYFPYCRAARGLHMQAELTYSTNVSDCFDAWFSMPQQHNTLQHDSAPGFPAKYEQWHEFDGYEAGHGTDHSGYYRGGYIQWAGIWNGKQLLKSAPAKGATVVELKNPWDGETGGWTLQLSTGERHSVQLVAGMPGPLTIDPVVNDGNTADGIIGYTRFLTRSVIQKESFDATVPHLYGMTYDPWKQLFYISVDNVIVGSVSTYNANSPNDFRDEQDFYQIFMCQQHGAGTASTMDVGQFSCWTS